MTKKIYRMNYRMRVYYCKTCDVYLEIPGECQKYECATCGTDQAKLKKVSDLNYKVKKEVTPHK
jgi:predicted RNA-binding Zn-ribbon protein involved in translation (DUF1610 family)